MALTDNQDWLYKKLSENKVNLGSPDDFLQAMSDDNNRKWVYDKASELGINMGKYDDFVSAMGVTTQPAQNPDITTSTPAAPTSEEVAPQEQPQPQKQVKVPQEANLLQVAPASPYQQYQQTMQSAKTYQEKTPMFQEQWDQKDKPVFDKIWNEAQEKAKSAQEKVANEYSDTYRYTGMQGGTRLGMLSEMRAAANKEQDPVKVMNAVGDALEQDYQTKLAEATKSKNPLVLQLGKGDMSEDELAQKYQEAGIMSPEEFQMYRQYVQGEMQKYFADMEVPKTKMDYFIRKFMQSNLLTQIEGILTETPMQRAYKAQGVQQYEQEHKDAGTWATGFAADAAGIVTDPLMWIMPGVGEAAGKTIVNAAGRKLAQVGISDAAKVAERAALQRGALRTAQRLVSGGVMMAGIDTGHTLVGDLYQTGNVDWANLATAPVRGALTGMAFAGGSYLGESVQKAIGDAFGRNLGLVAGRATHFAAGTNIMVGSSVLSHVLQGGSLSDVNWGDEYQHAAAMQLFFDVQGGLKTAANAGGLRKAWKAMAQDPTAHNLSKEEIEQFNAAGIEGNDAYSILKNLNGGKNIENFDEFYKIISDISANENIDTQAKYKLAALLVGGENVTGNIRPIYVAGVTLGEDGKYIVRTYDNAGLQYETRKFDTEREALRFQEKQHDATRGNLKTWMEGVIRTKVFVEKMKEVTDEAISKTIEYYKDTYPLSEDDARRILTNDESSLSKKERAIKQRMEAILSEEVSGKDVLLDVWEEFVKDHKLSWDEFSDIIDGDYTELSKSEKQIFEDYLKRLEERMPTTKPEATAERLALETGTPTDGTETTEQAQPTNRRDAVRQEVAAEIQPNTHTDGSVYTVKMAGDDGKAGYIVSGDVVVTADNEGKYHIQSNDVLTIRFEDGSVRQLSGKDIDVLSAPTTAEEAIEALTEERMNVMTAERMQNGEQPIVLQDQQGNVQGFFPTDTEGIVEDEDGNPFALDQLAEQGYQQVTIDENGNSRLMPIETMRRVISQNPPDDGGEPPVGPAPAMQGEKPLGEPEKSQVTIIEPNIVTMDAEQYGNSMVEFMGGKAAAVAYLESERDKADLEVKRLAKQQVTNSRDMYDFREKYQALQSQRQAAADKYNKLQNAIIAANSYKTPEERAAEAARQAAADARRAARRQTEIAKASNGTPAEKWNAAVKTEGNAVTRTLPDGTVIKGHYVLTEAGAATPSNDPFDNWNTSKGFPTTEDGRNINDRDYKNDKDAQQITMQIAQTYDGQAVEQVPVVSSEGVVYDGNGRTIAGNIAAANNTDAAYIQALRENAQNFGFTTEQVASMQHPRVYLQTDENLPYNTTTFAKFNAQEKKSQSSTNRAISHSKKLTDAARDNMLEIIDNYGNLDTFFSSEKGASDIVRTLLDTGVISQQEVAGLTEKTATGYVLSPTGRDAITDMLIGAVFNEDTIRMLGNDKGLKQSILRAMPSIVENRRLGDYALTDNIAKAIQLLYEARQQKLTYQQYLLQGNAFDGFVKDRFSPFEMLFAEEMSSGVDAFRNVLDLYNNSARDEANGQAALFEPRTTEDIKNEILQHYGKETEQPAAAARPAGAQTEPAVPSAQAGNVQTTEPVKPQAQTTLGLPIDNGEEDVKSVTLSDGRTVTPANVTKKDFDLMQDVPYVQRFIFAFAANEAQGGYINTQTGFVNDARRSVFNSLPAEKTDVDALQAEFDDMRYNGNTTYHNTAWNSVEDLIEQRINYLKGGKFSWDNMPDVRTLSNEQIKGIKEVFSLYDTHADESIYNLLKSVRDIASNNKEITDDVDEIQQALDNEGLADIDMVDEAAEELRRRLQAIILRETGEKNELSAENAGKNAENDKNILSNEKKDVPLQENQIKYETADGSSVVVSKDDYKTYMTPEAIEVFAERAKERAKAKKRTYAHPELAFIQQAVWDEVVIPVEELEKVTEIADAEQLIKDLRTRKGELTLSEQQVEEYANRLLDAEHGSAVLDEKGKIVKHSGIEDYSGEVKQERKAFIVIGRPAAGKSTIFANPLSGEHKARIVDSDVVKPWLDGFEDGYGAGIVQEASDAVMQKALWKAVENGDNIVIPKIGGKSIIEKLVLPLKKAGYSVELYYNEVEPESSYMRAMARFAEEGRFLSLEYLKSIGNKAAETFDKYTLLTTDEYEQLQKISRLGSTDAQRAFPSVSALLVRERGGQTGTQDDRRGREELSPVVREGREDSRNVESGRGEQGLSESLFDYVEWKNNDVHIGEQPKLIWKSERAEKPATPAQAEPQQTKSKFKVGDKIVYKGQNNGVITEVNADGTYNFEYPNALGMSVMAINIPVGELQSQDAPHPYNLQDWEEDGTWGAKEGQQVVPDIIDHFREYELPIYDKDGVIQVEDPNKELTNMKGEPLYRTFEQDEKGNWTYVGTKRKIELPMFTMDQWTLGTAFDNLVKIGQRVGDDVIEHLRKNGKYYETEGLFQSPWMSNSVRQFEKNADGVWEYTGIRELEPKLYNTDKYEEETTEQESADSIAIKDEAEAVVAEAAAIAEPERVAEPEERDGGREIAEGVSGESGDVELTPEEQDDYATMAQGAIDKIDAALDKVNEQLAVLGYYEADTDDELAFHESYGYLKSAEAKAVKDCDRLAKQLADDLGITLQSKRKVIAKANIAPAGGDISFHLPLENGKDLYVHFGINPNRGLYYKPDGIEESYVISDMYWRVEDPNASGMSRYGTNYNYGDFYGIYGEKFPTYEQLLSDIRKYAKEYLPKVEAGTTKQEIAKKTVAKARRKADKARIPDTQQVLDLFADAVEDVNAANNQEPITQPNDGNTELRNDGKRKGRTKKAEPAGQPANEDGALGGSEPQTPERPESAGVDKSGEQHREHDGERSGRAALESATPDVKELPESEWKNVNNYHARSGEALAPTTPKARYDANMAAIRLLKQLQMEDRQATREEKDILAQFSGWGGLGEFFKGEPGTTYWATHGEKSPYQEIAEVLNEEELQAAQLSRNSAYYTPASVINTLWDIAERLGFRGGNILEGSAGIGNILALMPVDISHRSNIEAVEIDDITAGILAQLYPDAKTHHSGFEKVDIPNNSVDLAITNVPFVTGLHVFDPKEKDLSKRFGNIHDFCIAKNVRKLRQGGLGIFITSNGTLDNSKDLRRWLNKEGEADVIGAFRLNRETFGGTTATSDIIVVRKRVNGEKDPRAIDVLDTKVARVALQEQEEVWNRKTREYETPDPVEVKLAYNQYFVEHPESMGGVMGFGFEHGDTRFGGTTAGCYVDESVDQANNLRNWIAGMEKGEMQTKASAPAPTGNYEKYEGNLPYGSLILNSNGEICKVQHGELVPMEGINPQKVKGHSKAEVLKDYNTLKSAVEETLAAQAKDISDDELKPHLKNLNAAYDGFVRKYGRLNANTSLSFLRNDVQWASIAALENVKETLDTNGKKKIDVSKTDVFSKRVVGVQPEPKADNAKDGVILSVQQFGTIRPDKIAEWLGKSAEEVEREIIESRLGFRDPATGNIQVRHEYLTGNVREKLAYAEANNENGQYDTNIEELRKALPIDIPAHLIEFNVGSTWIPQELYQEYLKDKFDVGNLKLTHVGSSWVSNEQSGYGNWQLHNEKNRSEGVYSDLVGKQVYGHELMLAAMNNVPIVVSKTEKNYDGTTTTITDKKASAACSDKISQLKDDFVEWARGKMQQDEELAERVQKIYNERFNSIVPMLGVDKMFLSEHLPNQNHKYTLYDHQQQAVVRATTQPVMLAHEVGTGKTITLISSAMEMRRLGTAKKPMIVVQNATTAQFVQEAKDLYPNAKILTVSERDRTKEGRQEFYAKIKYNDWDLIIIPQSVFDMIPDSEARMRDFIEEKIEEKIHAIEAAKDAGVDSKVTKRMEKELEMLREDLDTNNMSGKRASKKSKDKDAKKEAEQRANAAARAEAMLDRRTDDISDFDDMGIDALLIDEAHNYKHLGFATMMTRGVKGVDPSYSKRAAALYLKCQSVYEKSGHKNVVFATGTPISNTAAEIWTFMKYLMPKEVLKENDIYYFDDFVHNFGKINEQLEFATNGKFKANNRFAQYGNVPELMRLWLTCADCVLTREVGQVNDKVPEVEGGKAQDIFLPQSPSLIDIMAAVRAKLDEYEKMSGKEKKENSHIPLTMYGIAKRAAIDPRLVAADAKDEPLSKTNKAVEETLRSLNDSKKYNGTVAIFCDSYQNKHTGFNLFNDMKAKLVKGGVPESKIAIIRSEMTDNAKQKIFDAVREGEIRVIMGSTQTLGTGVNIQTRLHTLIHMDAPDRPMDYTQRNGRIIRQGNMHKQWNIPVRVLRFGVEDSLDVTSYQRLKTKAGFIDSIMNGKNLIDNNLENRVIEDVEEGIFDNPVAMLSGSQFALLKSQAERDLRKWQARKQQHNIDQILIANRLRSYASSAKREEENIKTYNKRLEILGEMIPDGKVTEYKVDGRVAHTPEQLRDVIKEATRAIQQRSEAVRRSYGDAKEIVTTPVEFNGLRFNIETTLQRKSTWKDGSYVVTVDKSVSYGSDALSMEGIPSQFVGLDNVIEHIEKRILSGDSSRDNINSAKDHIERMAKDSEIMRQREGKKFEHQAELDKAQALVDEYTEKMKAEMAEKEAKYAAQSAKAVNLDNMDAEDDDAPEISDVLDDIPDRYVIPRDYGEKRIDYVSRIQTRMVEAMHEQYQRELDKADSVEKKREVLEGMVRVLMEGEDIPYVVAFDDETMRTFLEFNGNYNEKTLNYIIGHVHEIKPRAICIDGEFMLFMGEYISDVDKMRTHLVHERQHAYNRTAAQFLSDIINNTNPDELAQFLYNIKGHDRYRKLADKYAKERGEGYAFYWLADELAAHGIEICYDTPIGGDVVAEMRSRGITNENILNIIRDEFYRQRPNDSGRIYLRSGRYSSTRSDRTDTSGVRGTGETGSEVPGEGISGLNSRSTQSGSQISQEKLAQLREAALQRAETRAKALTRRELADMADTTFSLRTAPAPKQTGIGYKVFFKGKDGKLYPPMVANPNGEDTPIGVWLDADAAPIVGTTKTGRPQVKQGGKGTQGGSGTLAYRPGWHLGEIPYALQFNRKDEKGNKTLFPKDFVWAEVEYAADVDYQKEANMEGWKDANGNWSRGYNHSLAGLKHVPENGFYRYRTNPNPETDPWIITGAIKVNRVLSNNEVDAIVRSAGREPQRRQGERTERMEIIDAAAKSYMRAPNGKKSLLNEPNWTDVRTKNFKRWFGDWQNDPEHASKVVDKNGEPMVVYHGTPNGEFTAFREGQPIWTFNKRNLADQYRHTRGSLAVSMYPAKDSRVIDGFMNLRNPYILNVNGAFYRIPKQKVEYDLYGKDYNWGDKPIFINAEDVVKMVQEHGEHDGVIFRDMYDNMFTTDKVRGDVIVGLKPNQFKSASTNSGEYSDVPDFNDSLGDEEGTLTRSEIVTRALVQNAKDNYAVMQQALRRVNADIQSLLSATRMQVDLDRNTVISLLNLYNTLMQSGVWSQYMPNTMAHIATQIRNAIGREDITPQVNKIMDYVVDAQKHVAKAQWDKLRATKVDKLNISGVATQGKVAIQGQHALKALNDALYNHLTSEQIGEQIAELEYQAENASDESLRKQYEGKRIGYMIAADYNERVETLTQERQQLRDQLDAARADKSISSKARKELVESLQRALRDNDIEQAEAYRQVSGNLQAYIDEQHSAAKDFVARQDANRDKIRDFATRDLAGVATNPNRLRTRQSIARSVWDAFASPIRDLQSLLRMLGQHAPEGEGYLYNHFMRGWTNAADTERTGVVTAQKALDDKIAELTNGKYKTWLDAATEIANKSNKMFSISMINGEDSDGRPIVEEIPLNANNALYIYAVNKMEDGKMKLRAMNITEEDVQALANQVSEKFGPEILDVVDWIQSDFFSQLRNRYNPTHEALFGAPMDAIENYFPLVINPNSRQKNEDLSDDDTDTSRLLAGTSTGAIKRRTKNQLPLDVRNADFFQQVIRHIAQMERWNAFAQWNRDANILFSDINFRNRVKGLNTIYGQGDALYNYLKDAFRVSMGTYKPKSDELSKFTLNAAKGVTSAKINFRVFTALKQLASFPAFFTYMQDGVFVRSYLRNWLTPHDTMKWAKENMPNFEKRISKRDLGDMRLMQRSTDWQWNKRILEWSQKYGMAANIFFDTLTCATGARAVYDSHYADYISKGFTTEQAESRAIQDAEQAFNTSQQSSEGAYMSPIQQDRNIITAALTVFRTSPIQYTRNFIYHAHNIWRKFGDGKREEQINFRAEQYRNDGLNDEQARAAAEKDYNKSIRADIIGFVVYGALLNILWRLAGQVPYLLFGDDDKKKKDIVKDAISGGALVSPITGLLGGGIVENAIDGYGSVADVFAPELPITQDMKRAAQYLSNDRYAEFASQALSVLMQSGTGFDPQTASDMVTRIATTIDSEQELDAAEEALRVSQALLSIPQSQYEQILVDQVIDSRREYRDALKDYERYQAVHTAPLTWWMRDEEAESKAEQAAKTKFDKLIKERKELRNGSR